MPSPPRTGTDIEALLAAAKQNAAPVYLIIGEPFETEGVARALIDVLVPPARRSFNLEIYDGRTAAIAPILDSLRMPGLFAGTKVIWVREPTLFLSGEKRADIAAALFAAWGEERQAEAAGKLLVLAAMAGWTQEQFAAADWARLPATDTSAVLGRTADGRERETLAAVAAYCGERELTVAAHRDESGLLDDFLRAGMPPGSVLLFTAAAVDRRKRIVKGIADIGQVAELTVERERSGALTAESIDQLISRVLAEHNKRLSPAARRLVGQRAGPNPAPLAMELEKLCLYAGDSAVVEEGDVRTCMRDLAESWIFDFTRALAQRQATQALPMLRSLFEQGEHPLRLLALIARELRLLLLARECLAAFGSAWTASMQFAAFRDRLLPKLSDAQREAFGGVHPFGLYLALQNASRTSTAVLQRALLGLQALDVKLKSSGGDSHLMMEAYVLDLCRGAERRTAAR